MVVRVIFSCLLSCLLLILAAPTTSAQDEPSDALLSDLLRLELASDPDVRGGTLQVKVEDGVVTLQGRVRDEKAREKATEIAEDVEGVTEVKNELKLVGED